METPEQLPDVRRLDRERLPHLDRIFMQPEGMVDDGRENLRKAIERAHGGSVRARPS
jgi:hypothetical protein